MEWQVQREIMPAEESAGGPAPAAGRARLRPERVEEIRSRIANVTLVALSVIAVPALAASLWRIRAMGWQPVMAAHILAACVAWATTLARHRLTLALRGGVAVAAIFSLAVVGVSSFGLSGGGQPFIVVAIVLATVLFGARGGLATLAAGLLAVAVLGTAFVTGRLEVVADPQTYSEDFRFWVTALVGLILFGGTVIAAIAGLNRALVASIGALEDERSSLESTVDARTDHLAREIEDRERIEAELRRSEEQFRVTFHALPLLASLSRPETGELVDVNSQWLDTLGFSREEVIGRSTAQLGIATNFADGARGTWVEQLKAGSRPEPITAEVTTRSGEVRELRSLDARLIQSGGETYLLLVAEDVTGEREREERLNEMVRLEAVGRLSAGIAHDFNNLMAVIRGSAELAAGSASGDARGHLERIERAVESGSSLTERLLAFSRRQSLSPRATDVGKLIRELGDLSGGALSDTVEFHIVVNGTIWPIHVDPYALEAALLNLLLNARDAMPTGGVLTISATNRTLRDPDLADLDELAAGEYVEISVSDSGSGIDPADLPHVFEPFFTTKSANGGTGLGLSSVYGFVKQSGGDIQIASHLGEGTTLHLYFPRTDAGVVDPAALVRERRVGGSEHVLLVEDDEDLLEVTAAALRQNGYLVTEARDGAAALDALNGGTKFELLFTDVALPGDMNGVQVSEQASRVLPEIKVLFATGYAGGYDGGAESLGANALIKPYPHDLMLATIRKLLDASDQIG